MARQRGFTLIELLIVIVIVATLAAIAISSYREQIRKGRRTSAYNDVATLQLQLERWRAENPCYGTSPCGAVTFTASGFYPTMPTNAYYTIGPITGATALTYSITATPISPGAQAGDRCGNLTATGNAKPVWIGANCP